MMAIIMAGMGMSLKVSEDLTLPGSMGYLDFEFKDCLIFTR